MSYLDRYLETISEIITERGDGLWIEAPKVGSDLWLVSTMSKCHSPVREDYHWHTRLQDALGKFAFKEIGYQIWTDVTEGGEIHSLCVSLARAGDSLIISEDNGFWLFQAEKLKLHAVGEVRGFRSFLSTADVLRQAIAKHLQTTIYQHDNCPLD